MRFTKPSQKSTSTFANTCSKCKRTWKTMFAAKVCINPLCQSQNVVAALVTPEILLHETLSPLRDLYDAPTKVQKRPPFISNPSPQEAPKGFPKGLALKPKAKLPNIIVDALAGTGKTFTEIEDMYRVLSIQRNVIGTEEQEAIWNVNKDIHGSIAPNEILAVAYNSSIATELKNRVPPGVVASTCHALGKRILAVNGVKGARMKFGVQGRKTTWMLADHLGMDNAEMFRKYKAPFVLGVAQFVSFCKLNLVTLSGDWNEDVKTLNRLAFNHGAILPEFKSQSQDDFFECVMAMYSSAQTRLDIIDFDDMLWLPWKLKFQIKPAKLLYGDEGQDYSLAQQELIWNHGERMMIARDINQAIYGFAGADAQACQHMQDRLDKSIGGVLNLPLTYTRRCSKAVVEYARQFVPDFKYFPDAADGKIDNDKEETFLDRVKPGHMVVCRTNAPLLICCLKLFKQRRSFKTTVKNDFEKMIELVESFECSSLKELDSHLEAWKEAQLDRSKGHEQRCIQIVDVVDAIKAGMTMVISVGELLQMLRDVFGISHNKGDVKEDKVRKIIDDAIYLSSIHQSKGLEARTIWWLQYDLVPHPKARLLEQERNLQWVASTRAIDTLVLVKSTPKKSPEGSHDD